MKNKHFLRLMQVALTFTALHLYTFTPVVNAEWAARVANPVLEYHYSYDSNGNITDIYNAIAFSTSTFTYDEVDRLTSAIGPYGSQNYSYDSVGNILGIIEPSKDANGNYTNIDGQAIEYDAENRPYRITNATGTVTEFTYDYTGQRVYKKITAGADVTKVFYVGNTYEETYATNGNITKTNYLYAGAIRVASIVKEGANPANTFYYHGDHLGSSNLITDDTGNPVRTITYEPWGKVDSNTHEPSASIDYNPPQKFTGQILDDSTELYYYGARYYDPSLKRFISPDTIVQSPYDPQSLNRYAYTRNNPLKYVDPTGHNPLLLYGAYLNSNPFELQTDFDSLKLSSANFMSDKTWSNGIDVAFDLVGIVGGPLISGMALKTTKKMAIEGFQALNKLDNVADTAKLAGKADEAKDFAYYMKKVDSLDVSTQPNKAVFYSGPGNRELAEAFAEKAGKTTLEMTNGGKWLQNENLYNSLTTNQADMVWGRLSERYAQKASGEINLFIKGANPERTFMKYEKPILDNNLDIYKYIYRGY